jgi:hypothetical protein
MTRAGRFEVPGADVDAIVANAEVLARWWEAQTLAVVKSYVNEKVERSILLDHEDAELHWQRKELKSC